MLVVALVFFSLGASLADPWWSKAIYYRLLVDSFKDLDGNGLGDLEGATKQLSYVRAIGADAVILSPISEKSLDCNSPGTIDFVNIETRYGTIDNFNALLAKANKLELKVLITLQLQTISSNSILFNSSAERKTGFEDGIVWISGAAEEAPASRAFRNWTWHEYRGAYYATVNKEAILNICSESVVAMLSEAMCEWLKRGAAGVLLNPDFLMNYECGQKLVKRIAKEAVACSGNQHYDLPVILVESSLEAEVATKYYAEGGVGANSVISYAFSTKAKRPAVGLALDLHAALLYSPQDTTPAWLTSTSDGNRIATRYGSEMVDAIILLTLILPGSVIIQQGDELGVADTILDWTNTTNCWPMNYIPSAAPFPWDNSPKANFTTGEPWMPLPPNYRYKNAKSEYGNELSHVSVMKIASAMRKSAAIGPHVEIKVLKDALAILRWGGGGSLLVVSNLGTGSTEAQLSEIPGLPAEMTVASSSGGSSLSLGNHITVGKTLKLSHGETVLLVGPPRHCGGPGPVDKITSKLSEGWQKINKYFNL
ncbi:Maltase 1 [Danaus plexippus plexippus]|uniref:alpha-glucosidase n=1 Tax=Danaus plexippus plexippus TaxID=278856 RepID=A0A212F7Y9_DANPL|nr:Maltase 1 [Danaus plexippus plexippus]